MRICDIITMITPNLNEIKILGGSTPVEETARQLSSHCAVFVTGSAEEGGQVSDCLFYNGREYLYSDIKEHSHEILSGICKHNSFHRVIQTIDVNKR